MDENKQEQMVSIIVPVYNAGAYLPEMIESVIFQNYNNWELLLIDNCSMDNSFEICQSYEKERCTNTSYARNRKRSGGSQKSWSAGCPRWLYNVSGCR